MRGAARVHDELHDDLVHVLGAEQKVLASELVKLVVLPEGASIGLRQMLRERSQERRACAAVARLVRELRKVLPAALPDRFELNGAPFEWGQMIPGFVAIEQYALRCSTVKPRRNGRPVRNGADIARGAASLMRLHGQRPTANRNGRFSEVVEVLFRLVGLPFPDDPARLLRGALK